MTLLAASRPPGLSSISVWLPIPSPSQPLPTSPIPRQRPKKSFAAGSASSTRSSIRHRSPERRAEIVRDQLYQLYLGRPHGGKPNVTLSSELPGNVLSMSLDPENVTLEAEYFGGIDEAEFAIRKPLLWFWKMFDRSPIGLNLWLGMRFRCMLGRHIFDHMGSGVKIHNGVDLTYGYKLSIGDGAVIHQGVLLHDRGGITIGKNVVIGSFARIFSHSYWQRRHSTTSGCSQPPSATARASAATKSSWAGPMSVQVKS